MAPRTLLLLGALAASLSAEAVASEEVRHFSEFTGISVSGGIEVRAKVSASASGPSLTLLGDPSALSGVTSRVDLWGTLMLSLPAGASAKHVVAKVTVPWPLTYAGAVSGSRFMAEAVSGPVVASNQSWMKIGKLESSSSASVSASSSSSISFATGSAPWLSASCSDAASIDLGKLQAETGSLSVSARSRLTGGTLGSGTISVTSNSLLRMRATGQVGLSCSESKVHLSGGPRVGRYADWACSVKLTGMHVHVGATERQKEEASTQPSGPRRLAADPILV